MRNPALHDALRDFALEAAALLTDDLKAGAEIEFDVVEDGPAGGRRGPSLYRYQPRTGAFIATRWERLRELPATERACAELGTGASAWLRVNGLRGEQAEPALEAMLGRLYEDATSFGFPEERFERVYREVELTLYRDAVRARVVCPLQGAWMEAERLDLGDGLALLRAPVFDIPFPDGRPPLVCVLERDVPADDPIAASDAAALFAELLTAMRLWAPGGVTLGTPGWRQTDEGRWQPVALGSAAAPPEPGWRLAAGEEQAFAEFFLAIRGATPADSVAWALARFEMGCERTSEVDALSDHLLGLRALLDANTDAGRASFALRLAALCAEEDSRRELQGRVEAALELERLAMGARVTRVDVEWPQELPAEIEGHLRALLRDVLCGYLEPDLKIVADEILIESDEPMIEIEARDLRRQQAHAEREAEPLAAEPPVAWEPPAAGEPPVAQEWIDDEPAAPEGPPRETRFAREPESASPILPAAAAAAVSWEPELEYGHEPEQDTTELEPVQHQLDGVTESADWGWDPGDYSAPV